MKDIDSMREARLQHIDERLSNASLVERPVNLIKNKQGSLSGCLASLGSHALASAMWSWFKEKDLASFKSWCYTAAVINKYLYLLKPAKHSPGGRFLELFTPLISDHMELIDWYINFDEMHDLKSATNHKTHDFYAYQAKVALRKDWSLLVDRCRLVMSDPPGASSEKKYLGDHEFYLALGLGDVEGMERALAKLTHPKIVRSRANDESGYTEGLIFTPAVIFAKLAWRSGYQVKVDSPFVPAQWLPVEPLPVYASPYDFLDDLELFQQARPQHP